MISKRTKAKMSDKYISKKNNLMISVIIVNYNVKEYLSQAISSVKRALKNIPSEILIVDNASVDGSIDYLNKNISDIKIIANKKNVGFSKANNQALKMARGNFIVILNPDTVVQENTFQVLLNFFQQTPDAGAATCKIINPDGTFSVDCRHSIPTPVIALWKILGFSKFFPKSRIFGQYNLTFLDPEESYQVPAISGSFMMIKKSVLNKTGYFDERFFMYCEDIDLCYRINKAGFKIYYVPSTKIIHYKGESTKKEYQDYLQIFNRSLYQFFEKHYASSYIFFFKWIIAAGIFFRGILLYINNFIKLYFPFFLDISILNIIILLSFIIRMEFKRGFVWSEYLSSYIVINVIGSVLFFLISMYMDIYPAHRFSTQSIVKTNLITFICLVFFTFFLKQYAYSRLIVLFTFIVGPILMVLWRIILRRKFKGETKSFGRDLFSKRTVIVGNSCDLSYIYKKLHPREKIDYEIVGWIEVPEKENLNNTNKLKKLGSLNQIVDIIKMNRIRQVVFLAKSLTYENIMKLMSEITNPLIEFKIVPSNLETIIGKSHIDRLDDFPLVDIEYSLGKKFNRISKRLFDLCLSAALILITIPLFISYYFFHRTHLRKQTISYKNKEKIDIFRFRGNKFSKWANKWLILWAIFKGNISFVGAPLLSLLPIPDLISLKIYKPGITGLVQLNSHNIFSHDDAQKYHLFYIKNQSFLLDLEILIKSIWKGYPQ